VLACNPTKHFEIPSQITPKYVCPHCGNRDQQRFREEAKGGDVVCLGKDDAVGCGMVVEEHKLFEGSAYRVFEGEDDKNHHGPAPNKLRGGRVEPIVPRRASKRARLVNGERTDGGFDGDSSTRVEGGALRPMLSKQF